MKKIMSIVFVLCFLFPLLSFAEDTIYEKDGVTYIVGNPTPIERNNSLQNYVNRKEKREAQVQDEINRAQAIRIKEIEAQTMLDYLLAEALAYGNSRTAPDNNIYVGGSKSVAVSGSSLGNVSLQGGANTVTATGGNPTNNNTSTGGTGGSGGNLNNTNNLTANGGTGGSSNNNVTSTGGQGGTSTNNNNNTANGGVGGNATGGSVGNVTATGGSSNTTGGGTTNINNNGNNNDIQ